MSNKPSRKTGRMEAIRLIISSREISSQEELIQLLREEGIFVTQATLSRDLKQMKVAKAASVSGHYVYVLPNNATYKRNHDVPLPSEMLLHRDGFLSIDFSGNLAVIRTRPGYASSLAYDIDMKAFEEILGTIAGDDTIFLALRQGCTPSELCSALSLLIPDITRI